MSKDLKIVVIGAGSASFGLESLTGIMAQEKLKGKTELILVDINEENLKSITALAKIIGEKWHSNIDINSTTKRKHALEDADFVILSVAQDREDTWLKDHEIGKKFGIIHYAENGGPGSFSHTARNLAFIVPILNDIHDLAPDAWLLNYTNPVPRISYAAEYAGVKCISLCHQYWHAYGTIGRYLAKDLGITEKLNITFKWNDQFFNDFSTFENKSYEKYEATFAGLNHFIWLTKIRRRKNQEDLYPLIKEERQNIYPGFEPLSQHLYKIFDLLPVGGDTHLCEYLPYTRNEENWKKYDIQMYDFKWAKKRREKMWQRINDIIMKKISFNLTVNNVERAHSIIAEMNTDTKAYEPSVNILNKGAITNLPNDAIVEIPAIVNNQGVTGIKIGRLPEGVAALCRREITIAKLMTKAGMEGDRNAAIQAMALDLMVNDLENAEKLVDEYLRVHKTYLPQFKD
ncbi:MAG: family 4 glycosyl hydrolase [Candidatus Hodarchaeales archaeon]|jgi:alpha-galactosidase